MTDEIVAITVDVYDGSHKCMGYPIEQKWHTRAEVVFPTPFMVREVMPKAARLVYLCNACAAAFFAEVATGIQFSHPT